MLVRRLPPALAAAVLAGLAATGCAEQSAGVRVGDDVLSESAVIDELDAYGQNEALLGPGGAEGAGVQGDAPGSYDQAFVSELLQQRVTFMLAEDVFESEGFELTDTDRNAAISELGQQYGQGFTAFPEEYRAAFVDDVARLGILNRELSPEDLEAAMTDLASSTDIEVSSRFGRWDDERLTVVPPDGPASAPGDDAAVPVELG